MNVSIEKHLTTDGYRILLDGREAGCFETRDAGIAHHALALEEVARLREAVRNLREYQRQFRTFGWSMGNPEEPAETYDAETEKLVNGDFKAAEAAGGAE